MTGNEFLVLFDAIIDGVVEGQQEFATNPKLNAMPAEWTTGFNAGLGCVGPILRGIRDELAKELTKLEAARA